MSSPDDTKHRPPSLSDTYDPTEEFDGISDARRANDHEIGRRRWRAEKKRRAKRDERKQRSRYTDTAGQIEAAGGLGIPEKTLRALIDEFGSVYEAADFAGANYPAPSGRSSDDLLDVEGVGQTTYGTLRELSPFHGDRYRFDGWQQSKVSDTDDAGEYRWKRDGVTVRVTPDHRAEEWAVVVDGRADVYGTDSHEVGTGTKTEAIEIARTYLDRFPLTLDDEDTVPTAGGWRVRMFSSRSIVWQANRERDLGEFDDPTGGTETIRVTSDRSDPDEWTLNGVSTIHAPRSKDKSVAQALRYMEHHPADEPAENSGPGGVDPADAEPPATESGDDDESTMSDDDSTYDPMKEWTDDRERQDTLDVGARSKQTADRESRIDEGGSTAFVDDRAAGSKATQESDQSSLTETEDEDGQQALGGGAATSGGEWSDGDDGTAETTLDDEAMRAGAAPFDPMELFSDDVADELDVEVEWQDVENPENVPTSERETEIDLAERILRTGGARTGFTHHTEIESSMGKWAREHEDHPDNPGYWREMTFKMTPSERNMGRLDGDLSERYKKARTVIAWASDEIDHDVLREIEREQSKQATDAWIAAAEAEQSRQDAEAFRTDPPETYNGWERFDSSKPGVVLAYRGENHGTPSVAFVYETADGGHSAMEATLDEFDEGRQGYDVSMNRGVERFSSDTSVWEDLVSHLDTFDADPLDSSRSDGDDDDDGDDLEADADAIDRLTQVEGIGPKRAKTLLDEFGDIRGVSRAAASSTVQIARLDGFSPTTAGEMFDRMRDADVFESLGGSAPGEVPDDDGHDDDPGEAFAKEVGSGDDGDEWDAEAAAEEANDALDAKRDALHEVPEETVADAMERTLYGESVTGLRADDDGVYAGGEFRTADAEDPAEIENDTALLESRGGPGEGGEEWTVETVEGDYVVGYEPNGEGLGWDAYLTTDNGVEWLATAVPEGEAVDAATDARAEISGQHADVEPVTDDDGEYVGFSHDWVDYVGQGLRPTDRGDRPDDAALDEFDSSRSDDDGDDGLPKSRVEFPDPVEGGAGTWEIIKDVPNEVRYQREMAGGAVEILAAENSQTRDGWNVTGYTKDAEGNLNNSRIVGNPATAEEMRDLLLDDMGTSIDEIHAARRGDDADAGDVDPDDVFDGEERGQIKYHAKTGAFGTMLSSAGFGRQQRAALKDEFVPNNDDPSSGDPSDSMTAVRRFANYGGDWTEIDHIGPGTVEKAEAAAVLAGEGVENYESDRQEDGAEFAKDAEVHRDRLPAAAEYGLLDHQELDFTGFESTDLPLTVGPWDAAATTSKSSRYVGEAEDGWIVVEANAEAQSGDVTEFSLPATLFDADGDHIGWTEPDYDGALMGYDRTRNQLLGVLKTYSPADLQKLILEHVRGEKVEFGTLADANEWRDTNTDALHPNDTRRTKTVTLRATVLDSVVDDAEEAATISKGGSKKKYGQSKLTDDERDTLEARDGWTWGNNGFEAMSVKAALVEEGAADWLNYYETNEGVEGSLKNLDAGKERTAEGGGPNAIRKDYVDSDPDEAEIAKKLDKAKGESCSRAIEGCEDGYDEACQQLIDECGYTEAEIDDLRTAVDEMGENAAEVFDTSGTIYDPTEDTDGDDEPGLSFEDWAAANEPTAEEPDEQELARLAPTESDDPAEVEKELPPAALRTLKKAWAGYRIGRTEVRAGREKASKYAKIINGVRIANGQEAMTFDDLDGFAGGLVVPTDPDETFPTADGPKKVGKIVQETLGAFGADAYDPMEEF